MHYYNNKLEQNCHYILKGRQLTSRLQSFTILGCYRYQRMLLSEQMCANNLPRVAA